MQIGRSVAFRSAKELLFRGGKGDRDACHPVVLLTLRVRQSSTPSVMSTARGPPHPSSSRRATRRSPEKADLGNRRTDRRLRDPQPHLRRGDSTGEQQSLASDARRRSEFSEVVAVPEVQGKPIDPLPERKVFSKPYDIERHGLAEVEY